MNATRYALQQRPLYPRGFNWTSLLKRYRADRPYFPSASALNIGHRFLSDIEKLAPFFVSVRSLADFVSRNPKKYWTALSQEKQGSRPCFRRRPPRLTRSESPPAHASRASLVRPLRCWRYGTAVRPGLASSDYPGRTACGAVGTVRPCCIVPAFRRRARASFAVAPLAVSQID